MHSDGTGKVEKGNSIMLERRVCGGVWDPEFTESISLRKDKGYFYHFSLRKEGKVKYRVR